MAICPVPTAAALRTPAAANAQPTQLCGALFVLPFPLWYGRARRDTPSLHTVLHLQPSSCLFGSKQSNRGGSVKLSKLRSATKCSVSRGQTSCGHRSWTSGHVPSLGQSPDPARVDSWMLGEKHHPVWVIQPGFIHRSGVSISALWGQIQSLLKRPKMFPFHPSCPKAMQLSAWVPYRHSLADKLWALPGSQTGLRCAGRGTKLSATTSEPDISQHTGLRICPFLQSPQYESICVPRGYRKASRETSESQVSV